jgi:primosomal replication protein N''
MNQLSQPQLARLAQQLAELRQQASELDRQLSPGKPQHWFDSALFSVHSPYLADYVAQSQRHLEHLREQGNRLSAAAKQRLTERLQQQIDALLRAFINNPTRQKHAGRALQRTKAVVQQLSASSQQLYQQLSEYQQFESRLLDMLRLAQQDHSQEGTARQLTLQARLGRCRRAIDEVEQQILQQESGRA